MVFMRKLSFNLKKYIFVTLCVLLSISALLFTFSADSFSVFAKNSAPSTTLQLPTSNLEYKALRDPVDVYSDNNVTAIIQGNADYENTSLLVYFNGEYTEPLTNLKALKQVKKGNQNSLLVSDGGVVYVLNLFDLSQKNELRTVDDEIIRGNYFDVSEKYLVTAYGSTASVYEKGASGYASVGTFTVNGDYPVAVNDLGDIFFVSTNSDSALTLTTVADLKQSTYIADVSPSKMVADKDNVYYVQGKQIARVDIKNKQVALLPVDQTMLSYDLGNLKAPSNIALKNGNLLITDTELDAVQEFEVTDEFKLSFTGLAVASGKTAYNRITKNAYEIENNGDTIATLDENKLLVFSPINEIKYSRENFKNFFAEDLGGKLPNAFALGNGTALLSFGHSDTLGTLRLLNVSTGEISDETTIFAGNIIRDICYQSGFYYVYATSGDTVKEVYKVSEKDFVFGEKLFESNISATHITADVFGNVYLANDDSGKIVFCDSKNDYSESQIGTIPGVEKLVTDLGGKLYALANGTLSVFDGKALSELTIDAYNDGDTIKALTLDYIKKDVYLLYHQKEYICSTESLNNYALSQASVSDEDFVISSSTADISNLKSAKIVDGANVYSVVRNGLGFDYNGLVVAESEYAYICPVSFDDNLTLFALAGREGIVLVNSTELSLSLPQREPAPKKAFTTTGVNLYFFPIVTKNADYTINLNTAVRLEKSSAVTPICKITFLDKDFYFVSANVNKQTVLGYIPIDFTVEVLTEDFKWDEYTIIQVKNTALYQDASLTNEIQRLSDGKEIRLLSTDNGVSKVAVKLNDGSFVLGYINSSAIKNEPNRAIRNLLIILAVTASVCGTASFFLLRKKR